MNLDRAQGCLLGQLAGDALGSPVVFQSPDESRRSCPNGVRELADGGRWNTIAVQPTNDSDMALLLARMLVQNGSSAPDATVSARFYSDIKKQQKVTVKKYLTVRQEANRAKHTLSGLLQSRFDYSGKCEIQRGEQSRQAARNHLPCICTDKHHTSPWWPQFTVRPGLYKGGRTGKWLIPANKN